MTRSRMTKSLLVLGFCAAVAPPAVAQERCVLRGQPAIAEGVGVFDAPSDGTEIAHFNGVKTALAVLSFAEGPAGRSRIETAGFRISGFVRTRDIPVYTAHPVSLQGTHLSIAEGVRVAVIAAAPGRLRVERTTAPPIQGVFQGWAPCEAVSLASSTPPPWARPGGARSYLLRGNKIDLFDRPRGALVTTLSRTADGPGLLFWGSDSADGFVHVEHHADLLIDAWAHLRDLAAVTPEEASEPVAPAATQTVVPKPRQKGRARIVRAQNPVELRAAATDAAIVIGGIDAGVDVVVVDVVGTWASVMPVSYGVAPSSPAEFWVRARDLGV